MNDSDVSVDVLTLNDGSIAVEGGRLSADETWQNNQVHLVRHWVVIPKDMTLTITEGVIVKFVDNTGILIEDGGTLDVQGTETNIVTFAHWADDSVGGDTDKRKASPIEDAYKIIKSSNATFKDNGWFAANSSWVDTFGSVNLYDVTVDEDAGKAYVPVTVSEKESHFLLCAGQQKMERLKRIKILQQLWVSCVGLKLMKAQSTSRYRCQRF